MHQHTIERWQQDHDFALDNQKGERRTSYVLILTTVTMIAEIIAGTSFGSMALLADGWHMATHVAAFMITLFAYRYSRRHANNPDFSFGTGKVSVLGGFASAIALGVVAFMMCLESLERFFAPHVIEYNAAIGVAIIGLLINLASAIMLKDHHHHHGHEHHHEHDDHTDHEHGHDHNLRAAYMHVLADALTSVLAITALFAGKLAGLTWMDPMMGIVGAGIIAVWSFGLIKQTSPVLLDSSIAESYREAVRATIEKDADNRVADFHIWRVGNNDYAAIISVVTHHPRPAEHYLKLLADFDELSHVTVEVHRCEDESCSEPV